MEKNKKKLIFCIIAIVIIILAIVCSIIQYNSNIEDDLDDYADYTPEEEISEEQSRETTLTLYFLDTETGNLKTEGKLVDATSLLENPYKVIAQALIDGPQSDTLESVFPENTNIIEASIEKNCVTLNFSEEILNYEDDSQKYNIINSLLNSLTQLTEVDSIKILVEGNTTDDFNEEFLIIY